MKPIAIPTNLQVLILIEGEFKGFCIVQRSYQFCRSLEHIKVQCSNLSNIHSSTPHFITTPHPSYYIKPRSHEKFTHHAYLSIFKIHSLHIKNPSIPYLFHFYHPSPSTPIL